MKVYCEDLVEGCILLKDVSAKAMQPMMLADTVITQEHIDFLTAFAVQDVEVKNILHDGTVFQYDENQRSARQNIKNITDLTFNVQFRQAVKDYQQLFKEWESGQPIEIMKIKEIIQPLIKLMQNEQTFIIKAFQAVNTIREPGVSAVVTATLSAFISRKQGMSDGDVLQLGIAGFLLDCGMAKLPEGVRNPDNHHTEDYLKAYRQHPVHGYRMLKEQKVIQEGALLSVLQHHERLDGSGFPLKLKGVQLHPYAKLISIVDHYVTCCLEHNWEPDELPVKAFAFLQKEPAGKLDKVLMNTFLNEGMQLLMGEAVQLSNGATGEIMFIPENAPASPYIRLQNQEVLTLHTEPAISIERFMPEKVSQLN